MNFDVFPKLPSRLATCSGLCATSRGFTSTSSSTPRGETYRPRSPGLAYSAVSCFLLAVTRPALFSQYLNTLPLFVGVGLDGTQTGNNSST